MHKFAIKLLGILMTVTLMIHAGDPNKIEGNDCLIKEPYYGVTFNYTDLKSDLDRVITAEDHIGTINLNFCTKTLKKCKNGALACYKNDKGIEFALGFEEKLLWENGRTVFQYGIGDACAHNTSQNYSLSVIMHCDYDVSTNVPHLMPYTEDQCGFFMILRTKMACLPETDLMPGKKCLVKDKKSNHTYNLNPLSNFNYEVRGDNLDFLISICHPILYGHQAICPQGSNVCMVNKTESNNKEKFHNYGSMTSDPTFVDGNIVIKMTSNEECNKKEKISSTITFECDYTVKTEQPEFIRKDGCNYNFRWRTSHACLNANPCSGFNKITGETYDFSSLMGTHYKVTKDNDKTQSFLFGICEAAGEPCVGSSGSCQQTTSTGQTNGMGVANSNIIQNNNGAPFLLYESGPICNGTIKHSTRIEFMCPTENHPEGPMLIEDTKCELTIHYFTKLACKSSNYCKISTNDNNGVIDLTSLILEGKGENYKATINKDLKKEQESYQYVLNICKPLNSKYSLNCNGGSAACRTVDENGKHEQELNLGYPDTTLVDISTKNETKAELRYFRGSVCPEDLNSNISTSITFSCDETAGLGSPILESITDCQYKFNFPTNILCKDQNTDFVKGTCLLMNSKLNVSVDLKMIGDQGKFTMEGNKKETVNLCDGEYIKIDYKQSRVIMQQKNPSVNIELICGNTKSSPETVKMEIGNLVLTQETPLICPLFNIVPRNADDHNDDHIVPQNAGLSAIGILAILAAVVFIIGGVFMVSKSPERREMVMNVFRRRTINRIQYSRVRNGEQQSLLMNVNNEMLNEDSDDDIII